MFWLVSFKRACDPQNRQWVSILQGPDNDVSACLAFREFEPHAVEVSARCMKGELAFAMIVSEAVAVVRPQRPPMGNPFSPN